MTRAPERAARNATARRLRLASSATERRLWRHLRLRQLASRKFRRQVPIGPYVADFACLSARLVVEVDGDHHANQEVDDRRRDRYLEAKGWRILRFWVTEIDGNLEGVLTTIQEAVQPKFPPPGTVPGTGGG